MARQVLPIVGYAVGFYFGGPAGGSAGAAIGGLIGGVVDPIVNQGPRLGETGAQTSQEGAPRAIIYGTASCTGNIIAAGPVIKSTETESADGGKGSEKTEVEHAYRNYAIRICEGPIAGILRIWEDDKLVYDIRPGSLMLAESAKWMQSSTAGKNVFLGTEDQLPSVYLNQEVPPLNDHPAHRGTAYIVFGLEDLTDRRGSIPQYRFEVATTVTEVLLPQVPDNPSIGDNYSGSIAPSSETAPLVQIVEGPYRGNMMLFQWSVVANISMEYRITVEVDGVIVINETTQLGYTAQINVESDDVPIVVTIYNKNTSNSSQLFGSTWTLTAPNPGYIDGVYHAYNGSSDPETLTLPASDYFGVLVDEDGFKAASWGPPTLSKVGGTMALGDIVSDIHTRCNVASNKYDVTELTDAVGGLVLAGDYMGADAINTLRGPYFFDKAEYSKRLHYPKRGKAVVATLTFDDLVEEPDLSKREQALEFAKKMHLFYQHAASGYAAVKATSMRSSPDARVVGETSLQVPVVLNEDQAAQTVSKLHKVSWAEAEGEVTLSVPQSLMRLLPSDNVGLSLRGQTKRLRIEKREFAAGVINLTLRHDRQSAYTSDLTGVPIPPPTLPPSTIVGDTTLAILDIGSRIDTEDDLHYLAAGTGALPAWYGYALQRSLDGGASYTTVDRFGSSLMGSLIDAVPSASEYYTDTTNTVRVQLLRDGQTLEDLTDTQFLSEQGAFALEKADGSWEVMQYRDVDDEGDGVFALTTLHRGQLNSGASAHAAGAKFVLLSRAEHIAAQSAWIGQPLTHRAASLGDSPELATPQTATYFGRSQIEWPVAYLNLTRAGDTVTGTWTPRHRFGTDDAPVASINFTGYRVSIVGTSTVTFDSLTPSFTYDVSAIGGGVTVSVSALNRITGAGPATSGSA